MSEFAELFTKKTLEVHEMNVDKGFWAHDGMKGVYTVAVKLALVHSEVSEALEEWRKADYDRGKFKEELADIVIRVMDLSGYLLLDLGQAIEDKLKVNSTRPYKHGKEF